MEQKEIDERLSKASAAANALSRAMDADVIFFNGDLTFWTSRYFVRECQKRARTRPNVIIIIVTSGGSADAAYRIARYLQRRYKKVSAFVPGQCKSAGTLIACGAHKIFMGEHSELGPLDIQLSKKDEIWKSSSGLNVDEAVRVLEKTAEKMFFDYVQRIKTRNRSVTYRTAAELSVDLIGKILGPISAKIDPEEIGENSRAMDITKNYAMRLDKTSDNFKTDESIDFLVASFPDHAFVIDRTEAREIFREVLEPTRLMLRLEQVLEKLAHLPIDWDESGEPFEVRILSSAPARARRGRVGAKKVKAKLAVVPSAGAGAA